MSNTRFLLASANRATFSTTVLKNGTGGGAPALTQDSAFPMSNLLRADRYTAWSTGPSPPQTPTPLLIHIDVGANVSSVWVGLLGVVGNSLNSFTVGQRNSASGYSGTEGAYTTVATLSGTAGQANPGIAVVGGPGRYWQFSLTLIGTAPLIVGKLGLFTSQRDVGLIYSPGSSERLVHPSAYVRLPSGVAINTYLGRRYKAFNLRFDAITATTRSTLDTVAQQTDPFVYLSHDDKTEECVNVSDGYRVSHRFGPPHLYDATYEFVGMP